MGNNTSIEFGAKQQQNGKWRGWFRAIKNGRVLADGETSQDWDTEKEAKWNAEREAKRLADIP